MWRLAALALVLCTGCSSTGHDDLLSDALWGDSRAFFGNKESAADDLAKPVVPYFAPPAAAGKPAPPAAPTPAQ